MKKTIILWITLTIDFVLAIVFCGRLVSAANELHWAYYEKKGIEPSSVLMYLDHQSYGVVATLSRDGRVGAEVKEEDRGLYLTGEYADLLYLEKIYTACGETEQAERCAKRRGEIREEIPEYKGILDKMDLSIKTAAGE